MSLPATYVEGFHEKEKVLKMPYRPLGNIIRIIRWSLAVRGLHGRHGRVLDLKWCWESGEVTAGGLSVFVIVLRSSRRDCLLCRLHGHDGVAV